jgi:hypothetical protein
LLAHHEDAGCDGTGHDYCLILGTPYAKSSDQRLTTMSQICKSQTFLEKCTSNLATCSSADQYWTTYPSVSVYAQLVTTTTTTPAPFADCLDARRLHTESGMYNIRPGSVTFPVWCDMTVLDASGWALIMTSSLAEKTRTQAASGWVSPDDSSKTLADASWGELINYPAGMRLAIVNHGKPSAAHPGNVDAFLAKPEMVEAMKSANCKPLGSTL